MNRTHRCDRRKAILIAMTLSLLAITAPQMALAQLIPTPPVPPMASEIAVPAPQSTVHPSLYTSMKVTMHFHTIAAPCTLTSRTEYEIASMALSMQRNMMQILPPQDELAMPVVLNNLAWVDQHLGHFADAEKNYLAALGKMATLRVEHKLESAIIKFNLAELYAANHRFLPALMQYRSALADAKSVPDADAHAIQVIQQRYDAVRKLIIAE
jgi:tetratricopeptide (TPR) repeat protein